MIHLIYSDEREPFTGRPVPYYDQDATGIWGRHYSNFRYLDFVRTRSPDLAERRQAEREIRICQRKMDHWQKHRNWDALEAARVRAQADAIWRSARSGGQR